MRRFSVTSLFLQRSTLEDAKDYFYLIFRSLRRLTGDERSPLKLTLPKTVLKNNKKKKKSELDDELGSALASFGDIFGDEGETVAKEEEDEDDNALKVRV